MKPIVYYTELKYPEGRESFEVWASESPFWTAGDTFSDDDMSMASRQVEFVKFVRFEKPYS